MLNAGRVFVDRYIEAYTSRQDMLSWPLAARG